jgi:hypothetical protein
MGPVSGLFQDGALTSLSICFYSMIVLRNDGAFDFAMDGALYWLVVFTWCQVLPSDTNRSNTSKLI